MIIIEIISKLYPIIFMILQLVILVTMRMNDIKHISNDIRDIKKSIDEFYRKILDHECRIAKLEGKHNGKSN
jgi:hypothetical protein